MQEEEDFDFFNKGEWKMMSKLGKDAGCKMFLSDLMKFGIFKDINKVLKQKKHVSIFCPVDAAYEKIKDTYYGNEKNILLNHIASRQNTCGTLYKTFYPGGKIIFNPAGKKNGKVTWKASGVDVLVSLTDAKQNEIIIMKNVILPVTRNLIDVLQHTKGVEAFYAIWRKSHMADIFKTTDIKKVCFTKDTCLPVTPSMQHNLRDAAHVKDFTIVAPTNDMFRKMETQKLQSIAKNKTTLKRFLQDFVFLGSLGAPDIPRHETAYSLSPRHNMLTMSIKDNMVILVDADSREYQVKQSIAVTEGMLHIVAQTKWTYKKKSHKKQ